MPKLLILSRDAAAYKKLIESAQITDLELTLDPAASDIVLGEPGLIRDALPGLSSLRWAQSIYAGVEPLVDPSQRRDYVLTNARGVFGELMSEFVFGYLLFHEKKILERIEAQRSMQWHRQEAGVLRGKTIGLLGVGSIGAHLAETAKHFKMTVRGFTRRSEKETGAEVGIDWHGHRDRDMAVVNSIAALDAGATRLHGTALGLGERVGNTPMDLLIVNLVLMGYTKRDLRWLNEYCQTVSLACGVPIPDNYPVIGRDAFRTATGVHAAAVVKAWKKGDRALMDAVYSAIPASLVGREQEIDVGPMSGRSNVIFWLEKRGITPTEQIIDRVFRRAKSSATVLTEEEILEAVYQ